MSNCYFRTFAAAIDGAVAAAAEYRAELSVPAELWNICQEPLNYEQTRRADFKLDSFKGKPTRKYFHVTICRLSQGDYELVCYVL